MIALGEVLLGTGAVIIICSIIGTIFIFRDTNEHCKEIENDSFRHGKNISGEETYKEIKVLKNTKTEFNSFKRLEINCKIIGLKKALREKISK